mmetsp:Transcript_22528/g.73903  ORF Transcript_22528/g.73903 Transcript_22528/m.73903 type:complete len:345 (-) Transcript_22528:182-1216(-)
MATCSDCCHASRISSLFLFVLLCNVTLAYSFTSPSALPVSLIASSVRHSCMIGRNKENWRISSLRMKTISLAEAENGNGKRTILVAGATGRVGRYVCEQVLLRYPGSQVRATFRNETKASQVLSKLTKDYPSRIELVQCDLNKRSDVRTITQGVSQAVWCASGFAPPRGGIFSRLLYLVKIKMQQKLRRALDIRGPAMMAEMLKDQPPPLIAKGEGTVTVERKEQGDGVEETLPRLVLLSSAAVTRPGWSDEQKEKYPEAAGIAIVRLNPLNILGSKLKGEEKLKATGVPYTILRSCGINSTHPDGTFQLQTGDTAVGRINPKDLAISLATTLGIPQAAGDGES